MVGMGGKKFADFFKPATTILQVANAAMQDPVTIDCISAVSQGVGAQERIGRLMGISSLYIRGCLNAPATELGGVPLASEVQVRILVVLDKHTNGAQMASGDYLELTGNDNIRSQRNLENTTRFTRIVDTMVSLHRDVINEGASNQFASAATFQEFKIYKAFKRPIVVKYLLGTTPGLVANVLDNSLHVMAICNSPGFTLSYVARIRYVDGA